MEHMTKDAYSGTLCYHAKKRLAKSLNLLVAIARPKSVINPSTNKPYTFRVNFVTLTLPAAQRGVSDRELKKRAFDPFIKSMRRKHGLRSYVWRAERQFNGNLHFHVTTDTYLPYSSIRDEWNRFLSRFHFIDEFEAKHGHAEPNSTDVHAVHKIDNIAAYMVKYMSKSPDAHLAEINAKRAKRGHDLIVPDAHPFRRIPDQPKWDDPIEGKVWDCSQNLKCPSRCEMAADNCSRDELRQICKNPNVKWKPTDHAFLMMLNGGRMEAVLPPRLRRLYQDYLNQVRNYKREPVLRSSISKSVISHLPVSDVVHRGIDPVPRSYQTSLTFPRYNLGNARPRACV
jgi:hypothetical protein